MVGQKIRSRARLAKRHFAGQTSAIEGKGPGSKIPGSRRFVIGWQAVFPCYRQMCYKVSRTNCNKGCILASANSRVWGCLLLAGSEGWDASLVLELTFLLQASVPLSLPGSFRVSGSSRTYAASDFRTEEL